MSGLYRTIRDQVEGLWTAGWSHTAVPAYWRSNDADPLPDPSTYSYFFRNEVSFGRESVLAFGGGLGANQRCQFGSVLLRSFTSRAIQNEDTALDLMADAVSIFRSVRSGTLSFIGEGSGFDEGPAEDGNWFYRGALVVFEYRFIG